jgi:hypothetical protein
VRTALLVGHEGQAWLLTRGKSAEPLKNAVPVFALSWIQSQAFKDKAQALEVSRRASAASLKPAARRCAPSPHAGPCSAAADRRHGRRRRRSRGEERDSLALRRPIFPDAQTAGRVVFTPHYMVWDCPEAFRNTTECQVGLDTSIGLYTSIGVQQTTSPPSARWAGGRLPGGVCRPRCASVFSSA